MSGKHHGKGGCLAIGLTILVTLIALLGVGTTARASWDFANQPGTNSDLGAVASTGIGPVYPERWYPGNGYLISLCVNNRSSRAFQTATQLWSDGSRSFILYYEPGPGGCDTWATNHRIDVRDGADAHCVYFYALTNGNWWSRMIVYVSNAPSQAACWDTQIERNHFSSKGLGVAIGLQVFSETHTDVHVMFIDSQHTVSWPQGPDLTSIDLAYE